MAFLGSRFEFRMLGSGASIAVCNTVINTIIADEVLNFVEELGNSKDFYRDLYKLLVSKFNKHFNIVYNGDGYSDEWLQEAENRRIAGANNAPESFKEFISDSSVELFSKYGVYSKEELFARSIIKIDKYIKLIKIEAKTLIEMVRSQILPGCMKYSGFLARNIESLSKINISSFAETNILEKLANNVDDLYKNNELLQENLNKVDGISNIHEKAIFLHKIILNNMRDIRENIDNLEKIVDRDIWGMPVYTDILHGNN